MAFDKKTWANSKAGGTPLNASGLNDLEQRIEDMGLGIVDFGKNIVFHNTTAITSPHTVTLPNEGFSYYLVVASVTSGSPANMSIYLIVRHGGASGTQALVPLSVGNGASVATAALSNDDVTFTRAGGGSLYGLILKLNT